MPQGRQGAPQSAPNPTVPHGCAVLAQRVTRHVRGCACGMCVCRHVMLYERPDWQAQALAVVPVAKLLRQAVECPQAKRKVGQG